jgi:outer membrane protein assembly factor BamB
LPDADSEFYSSPIAGDGKLYLASHAGRVLVLELQTGGDWRVLAAHDFEEPIHATPAIGADGSLFVRTERALYCFRKVE